MCSSSTGSSSLRKQWWRLLGAFLVWQSTWLVTQNSRKSVSLVFLYGSSTRPFLLQRETWIPIIIPACLMLYVTYNRRSKWLVSPLFDSDCQDSVLLHYALFSGFYYASLYLISSIFSSSLEKERERSRNTLPISFRTTSSIIHYIKGKINRYWKGVK